jgi:dihydroxy-acid dehydratase
MEDVDAAGGVSAILNEINKAQTLLNTDCLTVTGKTLGENMAGAQIKNTDVIHKIDNAYSKTGGLAIL